MEQFKKKLETIIDFDVKEINNSWNEDHIKNLERKYNPEFRKPVFTVNMLQIRVDRVINY